MRMSWSNRSQWTWQTITPPVRFRLMELFKGTVRPDWISMRVVALNRPWKGHKPLKVFDFDFSSEYLKQLQSSEPLHAKRPLILLLVRITVCMDSNRGLFRRTELQKCGRDINCPLGSCSKVKNYIIPRNPNQKRAAVWWIFSSDK